VAVRSNGCSKIVYIDQAKEGKEGKKERRKEGKQGIYIYRCEDP
jgi:hypothetical protein